MLLNYAIVIVHSHLKLPEGKFASVCGMWYINPIIDLDRPINQQFGGHVNYIIPYIVSSV